ncbi:hypothetical protein GCM10010124_41270 [Pilimelia terevasa]|uniref:Uncharacterized protein n=1 Tax=Pilimelia terevasa TaxID=53372 RepID=A0A8J3FM51_9ACTN|nr:hypothetical protein [Pilimelia terevasa]GGK44198.1 hypothetical protein GCM10010124_41270 [Pilimelia terevasa]
MAWNWSPRRPPSGHGLDATGAGAYRTLVNRRYGARPTSQVSTSAGDPPPAGQHPATAGRPRSRAADVTRRRSPLLEGVAALLRTVVRLARRRRAR